MHSKECQYIVAVTRTPRLSSTDACVRISFTCVSVRILAVFKALSIALISSRWDRSSVNSCFHSAVVMWSILALRRRSLHDIRQSMRFQEEQKLIRGNATWTPSRSRGVRRRPTCKPQSGGLRLKQCTRLQRVIADCSGEWRLLPKPAPRRCRIRKNPCRRFSQHVATTGDLSRPPMIRA